MIKTLFATFLIVGLLFSSGVFSVLLYTKVTGKELFADAASADFGVAEAGDSHEGAEGGKEIESLSADPEPEPVPEPPKAKPLSILLDAPVVNQLPEYPAGCEIVSLTMLLNFYGIDKTKHEMVDEMIKDPTPIQWKNGAISYWGHPSTGYVGDVTRQTSGFGMYHEPLLETLKANIDTAINLTGEDFDTIERHVAGGIPVVIWTTIDFNLPQRWVEWDTPIGPVRTTTMLHAVLLVGYDETNVYINDPLSGKKALPIEKNRFLQTWDALGKQAISYQ